MISIKRFIRVRVILDNGADTHMWVWAKNTFEAENKAKKSPEVRKLYKAKDKE